ncbi:MAG: hypothetical protein AAF525_22050 [Pseudomonadota bacterium]
MSNFASIRLAGRKPKILDRPNGSTLLAVVMSLLVSGCVVDTDRSARFVTAEKTALMDYAYAGRWKGRLEYHRATPHADELETQRSMSFTIDFEPDGEVLFRWGEGSQERMTYSRHQSNLTFGFTRSDTEWVESQLFIVTPIDGNHIWIYNARMVNNVGTPLDRPFSKFATIGIGIAEKAGNT